MLQCFVDGVDQRLGAFATDRGDRENGAIVFGGLLVGLDEVIDGLLAVFFGDQVELVEDQPARLVGQRRVVLDQFADDGLGVTDRVGIRVDRRDVDEVEAMTKLFSASTRTTPRFGCSVVNG